MGNLCLRGQPVQSEKMPAVPPTMSMTNAEIVVKTVVVPIKPPIKPLAETDDDRTYVYVDEI